MQQNKDKKLNKSSNKQDKQPFLLIDFKSDEQTQIKYFKKLQKKTQSPSRNNYAQIPDRKYHVKSGFNINKKYVSGDGSKQVIQNEKQVSQIFKRRVNSQTKATNKQLMRKGGKSTQQNVFRVNCVKKIAQDLKGQDYNFKIKKSSPRYSHSNHSLKSMQFNSKKIINNKQRQVQNSMQKQKSSFNINEVRFYSSKKSQNSLKKQVVSSRIILTSKQNQKSEHKLQNVVLQQTNKTKNNHSSGFQVLNKTLSKCQQPLTSYIQYISGCGSANKQSYVINMGFLEKYKDIPQSRQGCLVHIDINSLKLLQSIYLCIVDILSQYLNAVGNNSKLKESLKFGIIRQYAIVYLQMYAKIKIQYILCEVIFKTVKIKLCQYFLLQRLMFYWLVDICTKQEINQKKFSLKKIIIFLKLNEQLLLTIMNMLFPKVGQESPIDSFKSLRLTRQLDKRLPVLKQTVLQMCCPKTAEDSLLGQVFTTFVELLSLSQKQGTGYQMATMFNLQQYYNWNNLMIPPLFFLPIKTLKPYTLVMDLDQTLVYYNEQTRILKYRPYMDRFLQCMGKYFELIIFSSHLKQRTDVIVKQVQRNQNVFSYCLYKSHMVFQEGLLRKNVSHLGRNLQRLVFVDDEEKNTTWLPANSFTVKPFTGDNQDKELLSLADWLSGTDLVIQALMEEKPSDLRGKLKKTQNLLDSIEEIDETSSTIQRSIHFQQKISRQ